MTLEQAADPLRSMMDARPYDMYVYETSVRINAPIERVWEIVGDLGRSHEWAGSGQVKSITKSTDGPVDVGTKYVAQEKILVPFKAESEIVAYQPNHCIAWTSRPVGPKIAPHRWAFILTPEDGGTRLTHQVRAAKASGFPRLIQATMVKLSGGTETIRRGMDATMVTIKDRAESGAS